MALQASRVLEEADAVRAACNLLADFYGTLHQLLEHNSDQAIDWSSPKVFTAANATDVFTSNGHGYANGTKVRVFNVGGALPAGLTAGTDYYVIGAAANTFQLSATLGGAAVNVTTDGTGTNSVHHEYFALEANGNLSGRTFAPQQVSNVIGSLTQVRNLLNNLAATQGDHLGNINQLAAPLG